MFELAALRETICSIEAFQKKKVKTYGHFKKRVKAYGHSKKRVKTCGHFKKKEQKLTDI